MTGPRVRQVSSTRDRWSARRVLCSSQTATSIRLTLPSSLTTLASLSCTCPRKRSATSVCRPLTTMSTRAPPCWPDPDLHRSADRPGCADPRCSFMSLVASATGGGDHRGARHGGTHGAQRPGCLSQRGAGGHDIVDDYDGAPAQAWPEVVPDSQRTGEVVSTVCSR